MIPQRFGRKSKEVKLLNEQHAREKGEHRVSAGAVVQDRKHVDLLWVARGIRPLA